MTLPRWGGAFTLPSGAHAFAEPLDRDGRLPRAPARARAGPGARRARPAPARARAGASCSAGARCRCAAARRRSSRCCACGPTGCTTEELGTDLYGDDASNSSVRGEVSRLRKLGVPISSEPYRLTVPVESDAGRVQAMLRRGAVREAAEHYAGPLLALSDAPGVVRRRDELDGWLRHAVMTGGDREALWAWVQSPAGSDDLGAWKHALAAAGLPRPAAQPGRRPAREAARVRRVSAVVRRPARRRGRAGLVPHDRPRRRHRHRRAATSRRASWAGSGCPRDLRGRTVLDVGAWDGFFSFECERRGAERVVALDGPAWREPEWGPGGFGTRSGFDLARRALGSRVEDVELELDEISPGDASAASTSCSSSACSTTSSTRGWRSSGWRACATGC